VSVSVSLSLYLFDSKKLGRSVFFSFFFRAFCAAASSSLFASKKGDQKERDDDDDEEEEEEERDVGVRARDKGERDEPRRSEMHKIFSRLNEEKKTKESGESFFF
jgi:hypothetical protein